ncbi:hypothetical protein, partial [Pectobacterium parmentieri]|uniref:hypothetical protein n=1 Tax=Pectobacterium parmentieri TaxID=1905730 RepID=UPI001E30D6F8
MKTYTASNAATASMKIGLGMKIFPVPDARVQHFSTIYVNDFGSIAEWVKRPTYFLGTMKL